MSNILRDLEILIQENERELDRIYDEEIEKREDQGVDASFWYRKQEDLLKANEKLKIELEKERKRVKKLYRKLEKRLRELGEHRPDLLTHIIPILNEITKM